jgi:amidase
VREALPEISWQEQGELFGELIQLVTSVFTPDGADFRLARYLELLSRRDELIGRWERFFDHCDALLMPPAATVAYPHCPPGEPLSLDGGQIAYYEQGLVFASASLNGLPSLVMPAGLDDGGLPTGIQLVGARWHEPQLLATGRALENAGLTPGFRRPPVTGVG